MDGIGAEKRIPLSSILLSDSARAGSPGGSRTGSHRPFSSGAKSTKELALQLWQDSWNREDRGIQRHIPDLREWIDCRHVVVKLHLTQFLRGHGNFLRPPPQNGKGAMPSM